MGEHAKIDCLACNGDLEAVMAPLLVAGFIVPGVNQVQVELQLVVVCCVQSRHFIPFFIAFLAKESEECSQRSILAKIELMRHAEARVCVVFKVILKPDNSTGIELDSANRITRPCGWYVGRHRSRCHGRRWVV